MYYNCMSPRKSCNTTKLQIKCSFLTVPMHYRLRCPLGRFLSQKMFKSKVLFLSEKRVYLSRSSCFDKVMTQILYPKNCSKYVENKI